MIGAVIYYGKNTLVAELPMGTMNLQMKLSSIGVGEPADRIPLKDDEERQLQVKLYASSPEEAHLRIMNRAAESNPRRPIIAFYYYHVCTVILYSVCYYPCNGRKTNQQDRRYTAFLYLSGTKVYCPKHQCQDQGTEQE